MNKVILIGRLVADPELRYTPSGAPVCSFRIAVDRPFTSQSGEREADFINIVVWNKAAENTAKYMTKGRQIAIDGRLQIRSYDGNDGQRRWVTEVVADRVEFIGGGAASGGGNYGGGNQGYQRQDNTYAQQPAASHDPSAGLGSFGTEVSFSDEDLPF